MILKKFPIKRALFSTTKNSQKIDFGFKQVPFTQKQNLVRSVFDSVSSKYDVMNDLMSAGTHRLWKNYFVSKIGLIKPLLKQSKTKQPLQHLDVAGGTGDIAFRVIQHTKAQQKSMRYLHQNSLTTLPIRITISDINASMLQEGKKRAVKQGYISQTQLNRQKSMKWRQLLQQDVNNNSKSAIKFLQANAQDFSDNIPDNSMDLYTISFGIRNVTDRQKALNQAFRVLRPGGRFMCLEFSHVKEYPGVKQLYDLYSYNIIPWIGSVVANDSESYQYLVESIRKFPRQEEFLQMIAQAGFKFCQYQNLSLGAVAIHSGFKK